MWWSRHYVVSLVNLLLVRLVLTNYSSVCLSHTAVCVCLQALQGSGPGGRIVAQDVSAASPVVAAAVPTPVYAPGKSS